MNFRKQKEISGHAAAIYASVSSKQFLYTGSADKFVARWFVEEGVQDKFAIQFEQSIYALELIEEQFLVVGLASGAIHVFDVNERKELHFFTQHTVGIFSIHYNSKRKQLYVGDADGNVSVWTDDFKLMIYLPLDCGKIRSIDSSASGDRFALGGQDGSIRIFETDHFNEIITLDGHANGTTAVLFHPLDANQLLTGGKDALLKSWDLNSGVALQSVVAHTFAIYDIVPILQGRGLITASRDKNVKVWETEDLKFVKRLDFKEGGHRHSVNSLAKLDEYTVASCSDDTRIVLWEYAPNVDF